MNHKDVQNRMADYLEGDLALDKRAVFDAHLDGCAECRAEAEELREIPNLLRKLPDVEPPPMLAADVMRRIRLGEATPTLGDRIRSLLSELASPGIAIPTGAMLAAFVLALTSGQFQLSGTTSREPAELSSAQRLAPIPPGAAALARRVFGSPSLVPQLARSGHAPVASQRRAYFELQPVSTERRAGGAQPRVRIVARPSLASRFAGSGQSSPSSVDDWLAVVLQQPAEFARRQASLSLAEREHWVRVLALRAAETGSTAAVIEALQRRGGNAARTFANAFAAEARLASAQLATSR
ncbi:MAG: anti-sigma factor [Myxococcota bacterium]|nr:anti-sigma factor [Myxococcota bacterium]